jgi:hypothetical protein
VNSRAVGGFWFALLCTALGTAGAQRNGFGGYFGCQTPPINNIP